MAGSCRKLQFSTRCAVLSIAVSLTIATGLLPTIARANDGTASSSVWLISTRGAPHEDQLDTALETLRYWRLDDGCRWTASNAKAFHASDDVAVPTVLFIHGNWTSVSEAVTKGWDTYDLTRSEAADRPFRYVIWSWPADRIYRHIYDDIRLKAGYSDAESYYLAQWLQGVRPGVKISLTGHSFGPRVITGALQLLAGGEIAGRSLPHDVVAAWAGGKRNPIRAALLAPAIDADGLAAGKSRGLALSMLDKALVTSNERDFVLRRYPRLYDCPGNQALGCVGPTDGVANSLKLEVLDVACSIGRRHNLQVYCSEPGVCERWPYYTFLEPSSK
jgi:hypothetical protein